MSQDRFHLDAYGKIHQKFAHSCSKILSEATGEFFSVQLRHTNSSNLAWYYSTLIDEAYVFHVPQIRQYVPAGCTYPFFMPPIEGYAAELSFSLPLAFALRDLLTTTRIESERWNDEDDPYKVSEDEIVNTTEAINVFVATLLAGLAPCLQPIADLEVTRIDTEAVPAISRVYYGMPENCENLTDSPAWETETHLADRIVFCRFDVGVSHLSEWMSLHYHRTALEYLHPRIAA